MKSCFYCGGKKVKYRRDESLKVTVVCEKCGAEVKTPCVTEDSARGFWNMEQAKFEKSSKKDKEEAAAS